MSEHVRSIETEGLRHVKLIDATPIGINVRSTVATYANVHDELRKIYGKTKAAKQYGYEGWNRETIRQYLKVQEAGREDLLDLIEDGSITVFRAFDTPTAEAMGFLLQ